MPYALCSDQRESQCVCSFNELLGNLVKVKKVYEEDNPDEDVPYLDDDMCVLKTPKAKSTTCTQDYGPANEDEEDANIASNVTTSEDAPLPTNPPLAERVLKSQELKKVYDAVPVYLKGSHCPWKNLDRFQ